MPSLKSSFIFVILILLSLEVYFTRFYVTNEKLNETSNKQSTNVIISKEDEGLPKTIIQSINECNCTRQIQVRKWNIEKDMSNSCSDHSSNRGSNQKVVAFTYFEGKTFDKSQRNYLEGIEVNLNAMSELLGSDWVMRLYYEVQESYSSLEQICQIACHNSNLDLCNVKRNVKSINNVTDSVQSLYPLLWRFLPVLDANVDVLLSRDLDSIITLREVAAVQEFLNSTYNFHIMRDHPNHIQPIMGGLWGLKMPDIQTRSTFKEMFLELFEDTEHSLAPRTERNHDQELLLKHIWPAIRNNAHVHDSYTCGQYWNTKPFPTRRIKNQPGNFVGAVLSKNQKVPRPCPLHCRPYNHQDWVSC